MDKKDTFCPIRTQSDDAEACLPCFKNCERYVSFEISGRHYEGCAEHVQARMLGLILGQLAKRE